VIGVSIHSSQITIHQNNFPVPAGEKTAAAAIDGCEYPKKTTNKWFLVGPAAAGLKSPEASGGDDTDKR